MLKRENEMSVEAAAEKHFDVKQYTWHKYTSDRGTKLEGARGATVTLKAGDLFGVKEHTSKEDMYLVLKAPDQVFKVTISRSDKIMEDKAKEFKGKTPQLPKSAPTKVKISLEPKPKKSVKEAAKRAKPAQPEKVKLTATQKKIAKVKAEISALKKLKPNASNLRKIDKAKEELKKLRAKEKKEGANPKEVKQPAVTSKPVNPQAEVKKIAKKKVGKVKIDLHSPYVDDDDEEIPTGSVRYGGRLIEPDELEFDDDLSGINLHFDESWSSSVNSRPMFCVEALDQDFSSIQCVTAIDSLEDARTICAETDPHCTAVYQLMLNPQRVFDLRKEECRNQYIDIFNAENPNANLPEWNSEEFTWPHTGVPLGKFAPRLREALTKIGYDAMLTVDSDKYNSIAIFNPSVIANSVKLNFS